MRSGRKAISLEQFQYLVDLEGFETSSLSVDRALRSRLSRVRFQRVRQQVSARDGARWRRMKRDLGDHLLDDGAAEGIEVFGHQDECARAADDIVLVVFLESAWRIGMLGV